MSMKSCYEQMKQILYSKIEAEEVANILILVEKFGLEKYKEGWDNRGGDNGWDRK